MPIDHFPSSWHTPLERLRAWLVTDASALLVLAWSALGHAVAYGWLHSGVTHPAEMWMPLPTWSVVWAVVATLALGGAAFHRTFLSTVATGAAVGLHGAWALSHLGGALFGDFERGFVGFTAYSSLVLLMLWALWRGARTEIQIKTVKEIEGGDRAGDTV